MNIKIKDAVMSDTVQVLAQAARVIIGRIRMDDKLRETLTDILSRYETDGVTDDTMLMGFYSTLYHEARQGSREQRQMALDKMALLNVTAAIGRQPVRADMADLYAKAVREFHEEYPA